MITHAEILCLAIAHIDLQISQWRKYRLLEEKTAQEMVDLAVEPLIERRNVLTQLYEVETGTKYDEVDGV